MDTIQVKRGNKAGVSFLADGELGYSREEGALYIGDGGSRNVKLCSSGTAEGIDSIKIEAQSMLPADSDLSAVITAFNSLISAMKASGIMKEG